MNDKIRKLILKAGFSDEYLDDLYINDDLKIAQTKLAELIVQECIGDFEKKIKIRYAGDQKSINVGYGMELVVDSIKQKFGIL